MINIDIDLLNKEIITNLLAQNRIEDIKKIAIASGKNNKSILNIEALKILEIKMGTEYETFYNNLKD